MHSIVEGAIHNLAKLHFINFSLIVLKFTHHIFLQKLLQYCHKLPVEDPCCSALIDQKLYVLLALQLHV